MHTCIDIPMWKWSNKNKRQVASNAKTTTKPPAAIRAPTILNTSVELMPVTRTMQMS